MRGDYFHYTGIGGRPENEDTIGVQVYGDNLVAVAADGLGGQGDGKAASRLICEELLRCGEDGVFPTREVLQHAFAEANAHLLARQQNPYHMKTTAVYFCLNRNRAIWAHVGDSRLYHVYGGRLCHYTLDHSASQLAVLMGGLRREEIPGDAGRNRLIRAMGIADVHPDIFGPLELEPGGRHEFLLCTDGLWEYLTDDEVVAACTESEGSERCGRSLLEIRLGRSGAYCDNYSAIVIFAE